MQSSALSLAAQQVKSSVQGAPPAITETHWSCAGFRAGEGWWACSCSRRAQGKRWLWAC